MNKILFSLKKDALPLTDEEILDHPLFDRLLNSYFKESEKSERPNSAYYREYGARTAKVFLRHILTGDERTKTFLKGLSMQKRDDLLNLIDSLYDFYRQKERYVLYENDKVKKITHREFVLLFEKLSERLVSFYRDIYETVYGKEQTVYRILPSGGNAGILLSRRPLSLPKNLSFLGRIPLMEAVVSDPPFLLKTRENKRKGLFQEKKRRVKMEDFDLRHSHGVIIDVYDQRGLLYFDDEYLGFLVALGNLFQIEPSTSANDKNFDFILLFGTENTGERCYYYKEGGTYVGVCPKKAQIDYFGYAKKMILTLFNLTMIDRQSLPIHGAGVRIRKKEKTKNFFFLGDSGAGKSETLEAMRNLCKGEYQIDTIFDDMGTFHLIHDRVYATGTEIGAFVRLDDLDQGYSLKSADRAVYFNIEEENSRVVIPIEDYETTYTFHPVDAFLLADNFTDSSRGIKIYHNIEEAISDFSKGERVALNTTSEQGKVSTYFANPFGPVQRKKDVELFLPDYFHALFEGHVPVGKLFTRLSLDRKNGPKEGAKALLRLFDKLPED